ncbi:uncharacterized protein BO66DRAFT_248732 [Aspergillus aculeatinus CBS 121060]|uniref:Uncharacterized protein n=1 Tax=Aspergillus aculeatinus CBS 121060 TaxID=1448322 RepID=A0ACD1HHJ7_9EURO|nr:hypothetical protein BO66DRAFT_248732 [Aspergillus aculeatinus CBS 121060]RAH72838.1 hypothetical protein BO66DRAFT_248732 [Aspergillus aculeatinus CBS 121060]
MQPNLTARRNTHPSTASHKDSAGSPSTPKPSSRAPRTSLPVTANPLLCSRRAQSARIHSDKYHSLSLWQLTRARRCRCSLVVVDAPSTAEEKSFMLHLEPGFPLDVEAQLGLRFDVIEDQCVYVARLPFVRPPPELLCCFPVTGPLEQSLKKFQRRGRHVEMG